MAKSNLKSGSTLKRFIPTLVLVSLLAVLNLTAPIIQKADLPDSTITIISIVIVAAAMTIYYWLMRFVRRSSPSPLLLQMEQLFRQRKYDEVIEIVENDLKSGFEQIPVQLAAASYVQVGRLEEAEKMLRETLRTKTVGVGKTSEKMEANTRNGQLGLLAHIQIMAGKLEEAGETLQKFHDVSQLSYSEFNIFGQFHLFKGQPEQALSYIEQAEKSYQAKGKTMPKYSTLVLKAWALGLQGQTDEAEVLISEAIQQSRSPEVCYFAGHAYNAHNKTDAARKAFEKAYELDPRGIHGILSKQQL